MAATISTGVSRTEVPEIFSYVRSLKTDTLIMESTSITLNVTSKILVIPTGNVNLLPQFNEFSVGRTLTAGTYTFTNTKDITYGIQNMIYPWIVVYDPAGTVVDFYLFENMPNNLKCVVNSSGVITQLTLYPGNGKINHGQVIHSNLAADSNSNGIPDFLDLCLSTPSNWSFITRSGNKLMNGSTEFRFAGLNMPWLGNPGFSQFRLEDGFATAAEMGCNVVRSHMLGISVGYSGSLEPTLNTFDDTAFKNIDYSIYLARKYGIRLIIPLVDGNNYSYGGKKDFTDWRGIAEADFYTNATVIQDYKNYISHYLNHVNTYTGIALKDDPTILAWETGNEMRHPSWGSAQDAWTQEIATYIKSIATNHLVGDGHDVPGSTFSAGQLANTATDLVSEHWYPTHISEMNTHVAAAATANKVYFVGEYDWTDLDTIICDGTIEHVTDAYGGSYAAKVTVTKAGSESWQKFYLQLQSNNVTLSAGIEYTIAFAAKASNSNVVAVRLEGSTSPWTKYITQTFTLTSEYAMYSFKYTPSSTISNVKLTFNLGNNLGDIWLDSTTVNDGTNYLITNAGFENTIDPWMSTWSFHVIPRGDKLSDVLPAIEANANISGSVFWQLFAHATSHGFDMSGADHYVLCYPGQSADYKVRAQLLRKHIYNMHGVTSLPDHIIPKIPKINSAILTTNAITLDWQGSAGADTYNLQQSTDGLTWVTTSTGLVNSTTPLSVSISSANGSFYRLLPVSLDGTTSEIIPKTHDVALQHFIKSFELAD